MTQAQIEKLTLEECRKALLRAQRQLECVVEAERFLPSWAGVVKYSIGLYRRKYGPDARPTNKI